MSPSARSSASRRLVASLLDGTLAMVLGLCLAPSLGHYFSTRAVVALEMDSPTSLWKGPIPLILGVFGKLVFLMPIVVVFVLLLDPLLGRSPGKALTRQRFEASGGGDPTRCSLFERTALKSSPFLAAALGLLAGRWEPMALSIPLGACVLAAFAPALWGRPAIYDRLLGLRVCGLR